MSSATTDTVSHMVWFTVDIGREKVTYSFDLNDLWGDESDFIEDLTGLSVGEWYLRMGSPQTRRDRDKLILVFLAQTRRHVALAGRSALVYTDFRRSVNVRSFEFLDGPPAADDPAADTGTEAVDEDQAVDESTVADPAPAPDPEPAPDPGRRPAAKRSPAKAAATRTRTRAKATTST